MNSSPLDEEQTDAQAVSKVVAVRPELHALARASLRLGLKRHELLHAGPPLTEAELPCLPVLIAAVAAILYEGWARTPEQARALLQDRTVRFRAAQDQLCVLPLADVLSPSMWQVVRDAGCDSRWACSPLHGGAADAMRVGVFSPNILARLRWLDEQFAPHYSTTLTDPISLIDLADQGLALGDDCHGKTAAASRAFARLIDGRMGQASAANCREFLDQSPGFFLNLGMAASKCMLLAAEGCPGSRVVTAAAGNGRTFGVQIASRPGRWWTVSATPPQMVDAQAEQAETSLGAIGDSAIVDLLGFGAMTTLDADDMARPAPEFAGHWPELAGMPRAMLSAVHPAFVRSGARIVVRAGMIRNATTSSVVSLGVLDKHGLRGRLGGGYYAVPPNLFTQIGAA
ncbi:MAG: DUF1116 domain-containing protein [Polaromonas sp.]|nr:DUF1116 domain-containing protein [Polaromonas sp.]